MKHNPYSIDAGYTIINSEKGLAESIQHETMGRFYDAIHSAGGQEVGPIVRRPVPLRSMPGVRPCRFRDKSRDTMARAKDYDADTLVPPRRLSAY